MAAVVQASKILVNLKDEKLSRIYRDLCMSMHIMYRKVTDKDSVLGGAVLITDHDYTTARSNVVFVIYPDSTDTVTNCIGKGYRHFVFTHKSITSREILPTLYLWDAQRTVHHRDISAEAIMFSDDRVYFNSAYTYNFKLKAVASRVTGEQLYLSRSQLIYLYRRLVRLDFTYSRATGTALRSKFGDGILEAVNY